jgi:nucleotide-binding universal stress UspA family protein
MAEVTASDVPTRSGILVGYDGSPHSARALDWAVLEARRHDAPLAGLRPSPTSGVAGG